MQIPIGQSRPRGQPKKTTSALTKQNDLISSDTESDDTVDSKPSPLKKKLLKKVPKAEYKPKKRDRKSKPKN